MYTSMYAALDTDLLNPSSVPTHENAGVPDESKLELILSGMKEDLESASEHLDSMFGEIHRGHAISQATNGLMRLEALVVDAAQDGGMTRREQGFFAAAIRNLEENLNTKLIDHSAFESFGEARAAKNEYAAESVKDTFKKIWDGIVSIYNSLQSKIVAAIETLFNSVVKFEKGAVVFKDTAAKLTGEASKDKFNISGIRDMTILGSGKPADLGAAAAELSKVDVENEFTLASDVFGALTDYVGAAIEESPLASGFAKVAAAYEALQAKAEVPLFGGKKIVAVPAEGDYKAGADSKTRVATMELFGKGKRTIEAGDIGDLEKKAKDAPVPSIGDLKALSGELATAATKLLSQKKAGEDLAKNMRELAANAKKKAGESPAEAFAAEVKKMSSLCSSATKLVSLPMTALKNVADAGRAILANAEAAAKLYKA